MEKKIIERCFIAGILIMLSAIVFKEMNDPIIHSRIFSVGLGLCIPKSIKNIINLFIF